MPFRLKRKLTLERDMRFTIRQKLKIKQIELLRSMMLLGCLHDEKYELVQDCPLCSERLTPLEVIDGFNDNMRKTVIKCFHCNFEFNPVYRRFTRRTLFVGTFLCQIQTLHKLKITKLSKYDTAEIRRRNMDLYYSAILNFGSLSNAYNEIGIEYPREEIEGWNQIVVPFLGKIKDKTAAIACGTSTKQITFLRNNLEIDRYIKSDSL